MGSSSSKFRKHLQSGDEVAALHLYTNNSDLRKGLDPNCSYGDSHQHETPLHYAARHAMKSLLRIFLYDLGGNPNKTNAKRETALHCVCMERSPQRYYCMRRADCLILILQWRGATLQEGEVEKVNLSGEDEKKNTALHYAAASGLKKCVELLIQYGAPLFVENCDSQTPCDCAEANGHTEIALYLESKMVFSNVDPNPEGAEESLQLMPIEEFSGLRVQDLQEAKDQLLVETADMLSVPLFTAEALLRNHEWSREMLLESWMVDALACCEKCGVTPPHSLFSDKPQVQEQLNSPIPSPLRTEPPSPDSMCEICTMGIAVEEELIHLTCDHLFCRQCWERYLNLKIQEGDAHNITCPGFDCLMLVPVEVIENVVSRDMARRYLQFDIKAFVDSNPDMKWCPYPGCARAVKLPDLDSASTSSTPSRLKIPSDTSRGVDCGNGHYFCWECMEESHEPCSCENWQRWHEKVSDVRPEQLDGTEEETEMAANCLWLVTNSKPCPNCKSPIQKNEGCNHMKCSKCKFDFCWVCLEPWKRHNSSTGGYFKCNRYEVVKKVEDKTHQAVADAEEKNKKMQELNRFVHYYTRFKNHENSYKFEEPLLRTAKDKMMKLAEAVTDTATAKEETRFVEDAVQQLLKARRVLKCSYVYAYYLDGPGYKKIVFEFMQTELEECTEILSQMVNRLYLRTPRRRIMEQAGSVHRKRREFITAISKGLVPPETPPSLRKKRKRKCSMEIEDEDLRKAILASIQEVDPANPWIKDAAGRHTNVLAYLDWPAPDSGGENDSDSDISLSALRTYGKCGRAGCPRARAPNPRSGEVHDFCSLGCLRRHQQDAAPPPDRQEDIPEVILDEHMDLLRALEMSRLQYLQDSGLLHVPAPDTGSVRDVNLASPCLSSQELAGSPSTSPLPHLPPRPRSNSSGAEVRGRGALTPMERLDLELQRVLELSSSSSTSFSTAAAGQDDGDLLRPRGESFKGSLAGSSHHRQFSQSRFDESTSTVVTRVPNKSVEDLCEAQQQHLQCARAQGVGGAGDPPGGTGDPPASPCACDKCLEALGGGACGGGGSGGGGPESSSPPPEGLEAWSSSDPLPCTSSSASSSAFGLIKDLSLSNIHSADDDKTQDFLTKDFASLFSGKKGGAKFGAAKGERSSSSSSGGGKVIAANTPSEEDARCAYLLTSPASERSSSGLDVWLPRRNVLGCRDPLGSGEGDTPSSSSCGLGGEGGEEEEEEEEEEDLLATPLLSPLSDFAALGAESISAAMVSSLAKGAELDPLLAPALGLLQPFQQQEEEEEEGEEGGLEASGGGAGAGEEEEEEEEEEEQVVLKEVKVRHPPKDRASEQGQQQRQEEEEQQVSLLEMAENLLHMTEEMHSQMQQLQQEQQQQQQGAIAAEEDPGLGFDLPDPPSDTEMLEFQDSLTLEEAGAEASTEAQAEGERVAHSSQRKKQKKKRQTSKKERPSFFV